jgi:hypothetical protein
VGGALWLFDNNHRVYPPRDPGQPYSSREPIWTEFWVERKIVGETSRSWILTGRDARKVPKAGGPGIAFTWEQVLDAAWVHENVHRIARLVERCHDKQRLMEIERIAT